MPELVVSALIIFGVNAGTAIMYVAIRRWFAPIGYGYVGLLLIFLPMGFDALDLSEKPLLGGTSNIDLGIYILCAIIGVFVLVADLSGKLRKEELQPKTSSSPVNDD
jgi:hypothetical protein